MIRLGLVVVALLVSAGCKYIAEPEREKIPAEGGAGGIGGEGGLGGAGGMSGTAGPNGTGGT